MLLLLTMVLLHISLCAQNPELTLQTGHSARITAMAFSSDGKYLTTAGEDNIIIVWDFRLGKQLKILKGHHGKVNDLFFYGKEYGLISAGEDGKVIDWDIYEGRIRNEIILTGRINDIHLCKDDTELLVAGDFPFVKRYRIEASFVFMEDIHVWQNTDMESVTKMLLKKKHMKRAGGMAAKLNNSVVNALKPIPGVAAVWCSPDGSEVIVSRSITLYYDKPYISPFDVQIMGPGNTVKKNMQLEATLITSARTGNRLLIAAFPARIVSYDRVKERQKFSVSGDLLKTRFCSVSLSAGDSLFAGVNDDGMIYLWKNNGKFIRVFSTPGNPYTSVCFHPLLASILIAGNQNGDVKIIDVSSLQVIRKLESGIYPLTHVSMSPNGNFVSVSGGDHHIRLFNFSGKVSQESFSGHTRTVSGLHFISDSVFVSAGKDNTIRFHNMQSGVSSVYKGSFNPLPIHAALNLPVYSIFINSLTLYDYTKRYFLGSHESIDAAAISPDRQWVASGGLGYRKGLFYTAFVPRICKVRIMDTGSPQNTFRFGAHYLSLNDIEFSRNGRYVATCGRDFRTGSNLASEKALATSAISLLVPLAGGYLAIKSASSIQTLYNTYDALKIWERGNKKPVAAFELPSAARCLAFSKVNDSLLFGDANGNIAILEYKSHKVQKIARGSGPLFFSTDGKSAYFQDSTHTLIRFNIELLLPETYFRGHSDSITGVCFSPDYEQVITTSLDGSMKIWENKTGKEIATVFAMNTSDFIITTPDYYYYATRNAKKEIGFTFGIRFYPFEQYDLQYNRPDIVMGRLGCASPEMIRAMNLAYHKRLQKSGFSEEMFSSDFHLPEALIEDVADIPFATSNPVLNIKIKASDDKYYLDRINVWVNDVAIYGANGYSLRDQQVNRFEESVAINLSHGINRIRVSCMNEKGVESLRETAEITLNVAVDVKPDLYIFVIGASEYANKEWNLNYAAKDAQDVASMFQSQKGNFGKINTTILVNSDVTTENVMRIRQQLMKTRVDDKVLVFYAGHGLLDENLDYYLATYQVNFEKPSEGGLSYDKLNSLLDSIPAREKILLIDACHSGELDKEETIMADVKDQNGIVFRGARPRGFTSGSEISYNNSFELMKEMFSDLRKGTGAMVISSAGGGEFAFEGSQWKNGVFTWSLREGLLSGQADVNRDRVITVSELQKYVVGKVTALTGGQQKPTMRQENVENDFVIWK